MSGQSQGALAQLGIDDGTNDVAMEFLSITGGAVYELVDNSPRGIRGTLDRAKERVKDGLTKIDLHISMNPTPAELDVLIPLMGFAESPADTFSPTDTWTNMSFTVKVDRVSKVHTYATCYINRAVFSGQKGSQPIKLDLHIIGTSETEGAAGSFSTVTALDTDIVYAFHEASTFTLQGGSRNPDRFQIVIDNHLERQFNNQQTADSICPTDREISLSTSVSYVSGTDGMYNTVGPGGPDASGAAGTVTITDGSNSTSFGFGNLKLIAQSAPIPGKREIRLPLYYRAYSSGSTDSLVITHVNA